MPGFDITIDHVSKKFGSFVALADVDLKIEEGEFICIIGPAGCGKTVLLRLINGFEHPSQGDIKFGDEIVTDIPPYRRGVPTVFQNFALFPHMKVYDNIEYGLKVQNAPLSERKQKVREVMEKLDILELGDRYPNQISGGQKQRVGLARALVVDPSVLLLDEPLGSLDANLRLRMQSELKSLHQRLGITFILVTSNRTEAFAMGSRVIVMDMATIAQVGTPDEINNHPVSEVVARFCGNTNIYPGVVKGIGADLVTVDSPLGAVRATPPAWEVKEGEEVKIFIRLDGVSIGGQNGEPGPDEAVEACAPLGDRQPMPDDNHLAVRFKRGQFGGSIITLFFETEDGTDLEVEKHAASIGRLDKTKTYDLYWSPGCTGVIR